MVPIKKKSTLENILNEAQALFLSRGFSATSVDEICKRAKITKGGFFHYFKSKECLAKQVLQRFCSHSREGITQACCERVSDPLERVFALLDGISSTVLRQKRQEGCLIAAFIQELSQSNPEIQSICVESLKEWEALLRTELRSAKEQYAPDSVVDVKGLATYCVTVVEGAQIMAKANGRKEVFERSISHLKRYLLYVFNNHHTRRT